jgi:hypothetical protein
LECLSMIQISKPQYLQLTTFPHCIRPTRVVRAPFSGASKISQYDFRIDNYVFAG